MTAPLLRIGINGMGRIGRLIFRQGFSSLNIVAVNGTSPPSTLAHLLQYDSVHGPWKKKDREKKDREKNRGSDREKNREKAITTAEKAIITAGKDQIILDGRPIACLREKSPDQVDWAKLKVDIVLECSGRFKKPSDWQRPLSKGLKAVIVTAPAEEAKFSFIYGVNHKDWNRQNRFISGSSCTSNCLFPLIKVLRDRGWLKWACFSSIHSYTRDQNLLDGSHKKDLRRARAGGLNIIPTSTGAGEMTRFIFPDLEGRIKGRAFRVPTANVSLLDLVVETGRKISLEEVHQAFHQEVQGDLKGVLALETQPLVSSDFIGRRESAILDLPLSEQMDGHLLRLCAWYDNEAGFSQRMIDFIHFMEPKL